VVAGQTERIFAASAWPLPARRSESKRFRTISGWLALWSMIWDTSILRPACWNRSTTRSAQKCYPCSRYVASPMSPGRTVWEWSGRKDLNLRPPGPEPESQTFQSLAGAALTARQPAKPALSWSTWYTRSESTPHALNGHPLKLPRVSLPFHFAVH
jgi:hypothetical protein